VIPEALMAAAAAGGSALVGAAATDAWTTARTGLLKLFARGGHREEAAARWADDMAAELRAAPHGDRSALEQRWAQTWQQRLSDLVEEHPQLGDDLRAWAETVRSQLPSQQQGWVNTFVAGDQAHQYNAPGGSITVHHASE
jgi:hypothetical protein